MDKEALARAIYQRWMRDDRFRAEHLGVPRPYFWAELAAEAVVNEQQPMSIAKMDEARNKAENERVKKLMAGVVGQATREVAGHRGARPVPYIPDED